MENMESLYHSMLVSRFRKLLCNTPDIFKNNFVLNNMKINHANDIDQQLFMNVYKQYMSPNPSVNFYEVCTKYENIPTEKGAVADIDVDDLIKKSAIEFYLVENTTTKESVVGIFVANEQKEPMFLYNTGVLDLSHPLDNEAINGLWKILPCSDNLLEELFKESQLSGFNKVIQSIKSYQLYDISNPKFRTYFMTALPKIGFTDIKIIDLPAGKFTIAPLIEIQVDGNAEMSIGKSVDLVGSEFKYREFTGDSRVVCLLYDSDTNNLSFHLKRLNEAKAEGESFVTIGSRMYSYVEKEDIKFQDGKAVSESKFILTESNTPNVEYFMNLKYYKGEPISESFIYQYKQLRKTAKECITIHNKKEATANLIKHVMSGFESFAFYNTNAINHAKQITSDLVNKCGIKKDKIIGILKNTINDSKRSLVNKARYEDLAYAEEMLNFVNKLGGK